MRTRFAPALLALALLMISVPTAISESRVALAIAVTLSLAGALSLRCPLAAGGVIALVYTLAIISGPVQVGPEALASLIAVASAAWHGTVVDGGVLAVWHAAALTGISAVDDARTDHLVSGLLLWIVLHGACLAAAAWSRHLADRATAERAQRLNDLSEQRRIIARELHDTGVRAMAEVVMLAENSALRDGVTADTAAELHHISATSRRAAEEMRLLLDQLRSHDEVVTPDSTASGSLAEQLEQLRSSLDATGFAVRLNCEARCPLPNDASGIIARCLHEVRANVARHGDRSAPVTIMAECLPGTAATPRIRIMVLNAVPAPQRHHGLSGGFGLESVRQRLAAIDGELQARREGDMFLTQIDAPGSGA